MAHARRSACLVIAALVMLGAPLLGSESTPPVALGAAGLDVHVDLLRQAAPGGSWDAQSTSGIAIDDLGNGLYVVAGLPTATGTIRYLVAVSIVGDEERQLATVTYGATPGTRIVFQQELQLPAVATTFKKGDTFGSLSVRVLRRLPAEACAPGTTVTFSAWRVATNAAAWTGRAATLADCTLDATTGSYGATLTYDLQSGDTATVGRYLGEFRICYSPSACHTLPADNKLGWTVVAAFE